MLEWAKEFYFVYILHGCVELWFTIGSLFLLALFVLFSVKSEYINSWIQVYNHWNIAFHGPTYLKCFVEVKFKTKKKWKILLF